MNNPPWLQPEKLELVNLLQSSYKKAFGIPLFVCSKVDDEHRLESQELFSLQKVVLAHNNQEDPCLIYANAYALRLWGRNWNEMINMPSRHTAPTNNQIQREVALKHAKIKHAVQGYQGIRISKNGQKFLINNARIWTIWSHDRSPLGQAAAFTNWSNI